MCFWIESFERFNIYVTNNVSKRIDLFADSRIVNLYGNVEDDSQLRRYTLLESFVNRPTNGITWWFLDYIYCTVTSREQHRKMSTIRPSSTDCVGLLRKLRLLS